jgi:hypothetical protein
MTGGQSQLTRMKHEALLKTLKEMECRLRYLISVTADSDPELETLLHSATESVARIVERIESRRNARDARVAGAL